MPSASFETLHESIWLRILEFLVPTRPKPLSGWTQAEMPRGIFEVSQTLPELGAPGTTSRGDIRADALAKLMRTSSSFNRLAARLLYKRIITDDFHLLTGSYFAPRSHPSIPSKRELLALTTHLGLEYRRKVSDPSYIQYMIDPAFWAVTGSLDAMTDSLDAMVGMTIEADIEARDHLAALEALGKEKPFPRLSHLSFGAVFGGQDELWQKVANSMNPTPLSQRVERCLRLNVPFFSKSPIRQFCVRGAFGMLALPPMVYWPELATSPTPSFTFHYLIAFPQPSLPLTHPTRYILETRDRNHSYRTVDCSTFKLVAATLWERRQDRRGLAGRINLEIYGSSQRIRDREAHPQLPPAPPVDIGLQRRDEHERAAVQELQEDVVEHIQKRTGSWPQRKDDRLELKPWIDAGPCDACGWAVDRDGAGDRGQQVDEKTWSSGRSHRHCPGGFI